MIVKSLRFIEINCVNFDKINANIEESNRNKYLAQVPIDSSKYILEIYEEFWIKIKDLIRSKPNNSGNHDKSYLVQMIIYF